MPATGTSLRPIADMFLEHILEFMFGRGRGRIRWFKKVFVVILCYITNIKLQMDNMGRDQLLEGRDQDRKTRNNLLYRSIIGVGSA